MKQANRSTPAEGGGTRASMPGSTGHRDTQNTTPADLVARTWLIPSALAGEVATLADDMQVPHSALVRELLRHALVDARSGRLDLQTRPSRWEIVGARDW